MNYLCFYYYSRWSTKGRCRQDVCRIGSPRRRWWFHSIRSIFGQIVRQSIIFLCYKPANFPPQKINISISRKMLTNIFKTLLYNNRPPYLLTVNYFQTARTICAKKHLQKITKIYNIKMGEIEQVWADSTYNML